MAEVWFFHLDQKPLSQVLPEIVGRALERKLPLVIALKDQHRLSEISNMLWAAEDVAFLPHGFGDDAKSQPIWLTASGENPINAKHLIYLDGALPNDISSLIRATIVFDGNDEGATQSARDEWKKRRSEGHEISYWKQDENGKWKNQAA